MDYTQIAAFKKQRQKLRDRIKNDINKLAAMGQISNFQATHAILDKLISEADTHAKLYGGLKQDAWVGGLAETYLPSTLEIVEAGQAPKPGPAAHEAAFQVGQGDYPGGWNTWVWNGYGPLTEAQYHACESTHHQQGTSKGSAQAKAYMDLNKAQWGEQAIYQVPPKGKVYQTAEWDWGGPVQGKSADMLIMDDPPPPSKLTMKQADEVLASIYAQHVKPAPTPVVPYDVVTIYAKGMYQKLLVGNWYTGQKIQAMTGKSPKKLLVPEGYVVLYHPTQDKLKVVPEVNEYGNKPVFDDF